MRYGDFDTWVRTLPGVTFDIKWGAHRVYSVGGKMFVIAGDEGEDLPLFRFKASDMAFELLIEQGLAEASAYLQRAKWVKLRRADALSDDELRAYVVQAHALVAATLTRKARAALGFV